MSYKRFKNTEQSHQPQFQSGMTSQQKYKQIVQSVCSSMPVSKTKKVKGCQMHPVPSKRCRKCEEILSSIKQEKLQETQLTLKQQTPEALRLSVDNPFSSLSEKLLNSIKYTQKLRNKHKQEDVKTVKDFVTSLPCDQISISCYEKGSSQVVTNFLLFFCKLLKLRPTREQIVIMLRHKNVNVVVLALLYIRMFVNPEDIFGWYFPKLENHNLINAEMTVSEFTIRLLDSENLNYDGLRLPRIPIKIQNAMNEKLKVSQKVEAIEKQRSRSRSRSRQKRKNIQNFRSRSRSSSQSSSSSESSSGSQSISQKQKAQVDKNLPTISLDSLRDKIKNMQANKKLEKQKVLERYIDKQNEGNRLEQEQGQYIQSEDQQRYQMG